MPSSSAFSRRGGLACLRIARLNPERAVWETFTIHLPRHSAALVQPSVPPSFISPLAVYPPVLPLFHFSIYPRCLRSLCHYHLGFLLKLLTFATLYFLFSILLRTSSVALFILWFCLRKFTTAGYAPPAIYCEILSLCYHRLASDPLLPVGSLISHPVLPFPLLFPSLVISLPLRGYPLPASTPITINPQRCYAIIGGYIDPFPYIGYATAHPTPQSPWHCRCWWLPSLCGAARCSPPLPPLTLTTPDMLLYHWWLRCPSLRPPPPFASWSLHLLKLAAVRPRIIFSSLPFWCPRHLRVPCCCLVFPRLSCYRAHNPGALYCRCSVDIIMRSPGGKGNTSCTTAALA